MNRTEFMKILARGINTLPQEEFDNAINYYNEYFDEAGIKKEKKVMEELGNPEHIAEQIMADYEEKKLSFSKPVKKVYPIWMIVILVFTSPFWLTILLAIVLLLFSLFIVAFACIFSLFIITFAFFVTGVISFAVGLATLFQHVPTGLYVLGISFGLMGLSLLIFIPSTLLVSSFGKLIPYLCTKLFRKGKKYEKNI